MNWIDDKYKETLGNKKFPSNLKEAGWEKAQALLDKEFPVAKAAGGFIAGKYIMVAVALLIIPAAIWYFNSPTVLPAVSDSKPNEQVQPSPTNDPTNSMSTIESENKNTEKSTKNDPSFNDGLNPNLVEDVVSNEALNNDPPVNSDNQKSNDQKLISETDDGFVANPSEPKDVETEDRGIEKVVDSNSEGGISGNDQIPKPNSTEPKETLDEPSGEETPNEDGDGMTDGKISPSGEKDKPADEKTEEPDFKDENLKEKKPENEGDFKGQPNPDQNENEGVIDDSTSTNEDNDKIMDNENPIPDLAPPYKAKRKDHLAFANIPDLPSVGDYQLFSRERFSISLWGGYSYIDKFLTADNQSYLDKRQNEEKAIWASSSGFKIDYFLDNRWTFGFGLGWAEYGEELNYGISQRDTSKIDGRNSSPSNFSNIIDVDSMRIITGINQGHWNYTIVTEDSDSAVQLNNGKTSWQYLEIPFTVGYRFGKGRIKPWLKTGVSFGIPVNTNFRYLNAEATNLSDVRLTNSEWVAPIQYNYLFEAGLDCFITRNFSVRVNATSSFQLNSSFQQYSDVRQQYYRLGMSIGLAYNF